MKKYDIILEKILLVLLVMITSLVYSNDLDKYESKRVFDKNMDAIMIRHYGIYKSDPEMSRAMQNFKDEEEVDEEEWNEASQWYKDNAYEVIEVKESENNSILTVKATVVVK